MFRQCSHKWGQHIIVWLIGCFRYAQGGHPEDSTNRLSGYARLKFLFFPPRPSIWCLFLLLKYWSSLRRRRNFHLHQVQSTAPQSPISVKWWRGWCWRGYIGLSHPFRSHHPTSQKYWSLQISICGPKRQWQGMCPHGYGRWRNECIFLLFPRWLGTISLIFSSSTSMIYVFRGQLLEQHLQLKAITLLMDHLQAEIHSPHQSSPLNGQTLRFPAKSNSTKDFSSYSLYKSYYYFYLTLESTVFDE